MAALVRSSSVPEAGGEPAWCRLPGSALGSIGRWKREPPLWKIFQKRDRLGLDFENAYQDYMEKKVKNKEKQVHLFHREPLTVSWKARSLLTSVCVGAGGVVLGPLLEKSHQRAKRSEKSRGEEIGW